jgi:membrane-bound lytic murein transglycosylase D
MSCNRFSWLTAAEPRKVFGVVALLFAWPIYASELPRPAGLEPEILFWRTVFVEVTSDQALVHDKRHLGVIYEKIDLPGKAGSRKRREAFDAIRKKYSGVLNNLATGKRRGLTTEEQRILALWPKGVTNEGLRQAAKRLRVQQGLSDRFYAGLIRSGRWQEHIRTNLRREGVPESLAALPHVESSYNPEARSHVGAAGLWQFTRPTGKRFMRIDHIVDERRDPYLSSVAAARLLSYNYSILQSWPLAVTAYNHGVAGMRRAVKKMGTDDIEVIIRNYDGRSFGFASRNFYGAFLAAREAEINAEKYFGPIHKDSPREEYVVVLPDYIPAATLETVLGISRSKLQSYNPALMPPVWDASKYVPRGYSLRLPEVAGNQTAKQIIVDLPASRRFADQTPDLYHKVARGDSLSVIAARHKTSVSELVALNDLKSRHRIRIGQTLRLPFSGAETAQSISSDTTIYVVRSGDTFSGVAHRAGISEQQLRALNSIENQNRIYPGQELILVMQSEVSEPTPQPQLPDLVQADSPKIPDPEPAVAELVDVKENNELNLLADPSDYLVADDGSIEVQAAETLGHYADWLSVPTQRLRNVNNYSFRRPVVIGERLRLDLKSVSAGTFAARRIAYHRELQEAFFTRYRITDTTVHRLSKGESVWLLTRSRYKVPVWLLRQYNPDLNLNRVRPGTELVFPHIEPVQAALERSTTVATGP